MFNHSAAVAEIAAFLAAAIHAQGEQIDISLVEAAALLHDLDKAFTADHPLKSLGHGDAGAAWLRDQGYDKLAPAVGCHPVMRLADDDRYADCVVRGSIEEKVVAYADKRAIQDLVSLEQRFERWRARYPESTTLVVARERALQLEEEVCAAAGIAPAGVRRLAWVAAAVSANSSSAAFPSGRTIRLLPPSS
jgi:putative nucleotidyltransferase with HDIG domain